MAKNSAGAAFLNSKKKLEELLAARESGLELDSELKESDVFGLQHHHLLTCLEKTTVSVGAFTSRGVLFLFSLDFYLPLLLLCLDIILS